jgi:hypothetical protein
MIGILIRGRNERDTQRKDGLMKIEGDCHVKVVIDIKITCPKLQNTKARSSQQKLGEAQTRFTFRILRRKQSCRYLDFESLASRTETTFCLF